MTQADANLLNEINGKITWYDDHARTQRRCHYAILVALIASTALAPSLSLVASAPVAAGARAADLTILGVPPQWVAVASAAFALLGALVAAVRKYAACSEKYATYYLMGVTLRQLRSDYSDELEDIDSPEKERAVTRAARTAFRGMVNNETTRSFLGVSTTLGFDISKIELPSGRFDFGIGRDGGQPGGTAAA
jgi:hypothetical protein